MNEADHPAVDSAAVETRAPDDTYLRLAAGMLGVLALAAALYLAYASFVVLKEVCPLCVAT